MIGIVAAMPGLRRCPRLALELDALSARRVAAESRGSATIRPGNPDAGQDPGELGAVTARCPAVSGITRGF